MHGDRTSLATVAIFFMQMRYCHHRCFDIILYCLQQGCCSCYHDSMTATSAAGHMVVPGQQNSHRHCSRDRETFIYILKHKLVHIIYTFSLCNYQLFVILLMQQVYSALLTWLQSYCGSYATLTVVDIDCIIAAVVGYVFSLD